MSELPGGQEPCPYPLETCRCGAQFFFAWTGGKRIPVSPHPDEERGNLRIRPSGVDGYPVATVLNTAQRFGKHGLYLSHFVDCPQADRFRTRRRAP